MKIRGGVGKISVPIVERTFLEKHEYGALWLLICSPLEKHIQWKRW